MSRFANKMEYIVESNNAGRLKWILSEIPDDWDVKFMLRLNGKVKTIVATPPKEEFTT